MDKDSYKNESSSCTFHHPSEALFSVQLLEFKTSLLEALEELRMRREAEIQYEEQISKFVVEKQELQWQKETLQHQKETLTKQHKEAMGVFKKQLQVRMCGLEEEKGKYQLAAEIKDKEIEGLKETLKTLQISKYSLQKKLSELEQKLQLHLLAKDDHHKQLTEVEKYYTTITYQFGMVKESHEKLEQNVQEAVQLNKRLSEVNKTQESEICHLKQELKKLTTNLIRSKVICQNRVGEENANRTIKEQQLQELQQKLQMETQVNKKISEESVRSQNEKLVILNSLQHLQQLLQRQTQINAKMETELKALNEDKQTLERDNELQRKKVKENEEKYLNLQNEHEKEAQTWKRDEKNLLEEVDTLKSELVSLKEEYIKLQESYDKLSCPPNLHFEQDRALENGPGINESGNEIPAEQKEYECSESNIQEIISENTMTFSSTMDQTEAQQNNGNLQREEIVIEDFQIQEKEMDIAQPHEEIQSESSQSQLSCKDIAKGQNLQAQPTDFIKAGTTQIKERDPECTELKSLSIPSSVAKNPMEPGKLSPHRTEELILCNVDGILGAEKHVNGNAINQLLFNPNCEASTTQWDKGEFQSEMVNKESRLVVNNEESSVNRDISDTNQVEAELEISLKNNHVTSQKVSPSESGLDGEQCKTEQLELLKVKEYDVLPCKQTSDVQEECSTTMGEVDFSSPIPPSSLSNILGEFVDRSKEKPNIMAVSVKSTANPGESCEQKNFSEIQIRQLEQTFTEQVESDKNMKTCPLEVNTENSQTSQSKNMGISICEHNIEKKTTEDLPFSSKENQISDDQVQEAKHNSSTRNENSQVSKFNARLNSLLNTREKIESLSNVFVSKSKYVEGQLEESNSFPIKPSGDLVNRSGRSAFDLSTSDKKTEKTPVHLNFLDFSPWSKINQAESQTETTSPSTVAFLLTERPRCPSESKRILSPSYCGSLGKNAVITESRLDSTSINRVADTLNTSSIHRGPKRDPSEEWNAIAKTFYDSSFPTEHADRKSSKLHSLSQLTLRTETVTLAPSSLGQEEKGKEEDDSNDQTSETQMLPISENPHQSRKRKSEEMLEKAVED
ncbi:coiled-coil domain-containing protein 73 [Tachyglossus aculeatus]|uniref:coiled-coil domain-containing protein 73 n=1 Tax=Tachyglossus aculeatus TaxID=9261 RepID=UPI0018F4076F|nr:coiled-coil domain-containing protein 73 [Tachyglossus aculeatus]XP_038620050.1 coiled-coil domain-containing protein 73 [Tachyglossus aculeatus]XP_038620051.1 coiled-coil domain-containing protein 73 [Tachyglossus aculeatus]XP_038620052.1 coiled-coil domain-containing protein 73 [Tachyglossus aculeatus]XP_038620053.1 coiled-coil domain-containing protein 73 [Tachyglossus aculeatus]XP_038620054.1 coiled-coil domain-containing protein 73 [Tachyglossus aculeatus]XP_038620055.1 coiled-coil do